MINKIELYWVMQIRATMNLKMKALRRFFESNHKAKLFKGNESKVFHPIHVAFGCQLACLHRFYFTKRRILLNLPLPIKEPTYLVFKNFSLWLHQG